MKLDRKRVNVKDLSTEAKDHMFRLMEKHYKNTLRTTFEEDLAEKDWVLLLFEPNSDIPVGFSTQKLFEVNFDGQDYLILFSGDTIINEKHWGSLALSLAFGELMLSILKQNPDVPLYWMLISKGVRTYKFLPAFFINYYPSYGKETPEHITKLMHYLGKHRYPDAYNSETGIVKAQANGQFLDQKYEPKEAVKDPEEIFFYEKNPNHAKGDELLCLTRLSMDNINSFIKRVLNRL